MASTEKGRGLRKFAGVVISIASILLIFKLTETSVTWSVITEANLKLLADKGASHGSARRARLFLLRDSSMRSFLSLHYPFLCFYLDFVIAILIRNIAYINLPSLLYEGGICEPSTLRRIADVAEKFWRRI